MTNALDALDEGEADVLLAAKLDRVTHRGSIIETKGGSYRLQDAKARTRRAKPTPDPSGSRPVDQAQITK